MFICYANHLTFFCSCLILNARRVQGSRHCVTCRVTASEHELHEQGHGFLYAALCQGNKTHHRNEEKRLGCRIFPKWFYCRYLLTSTAKCVIGISYVIYLVVSIQSLLNIKVGFNYNHTIPEDSHISQYTMRDKELFPDDGPVVTMLLDGYMPYHQSETQREIQCIIKDLQENHPEMFTVRTCDWLSDFVHHTERYNYSIIDQQQFIYYLIMDFLPQFPQHNNNIKFNSDNSSIIASRFYLYMYQMNTYESQVNVLVDMQKVTNNASYPLHLYSPEFVYYEHHTSVIKNTILTLTVTIISMLLVSLIFLPHLIPVSCVMISMVSVVVGMLGLLHMWHVYLSVFQIIQTVIAIGLTVHFTVQVSHAFMVATGRTRNERVSSALQRCGETIVHDAICLILGIILLPFGQSYLFETFFKSMFIAILLGLWHALVLLPTLLSFIGPRRTWKPKVYIAVSPSCRSMSSNFNPFRTSIRSRCSGRNIISSKPENDNIPEQSTAEPQLNPRILESPYDKQSCSSMVENVLSSIQEDEES